MYGTCIIADIHVIYNHTVQLVTYSQVMISLVVINQSNNGFSKKLASAHAEEHSASDLVKTRLIILYVFYLRILTYNIS